MFKKFALFNYGFRPFFLGAALYALLTVPLWLLILHGAIKTSSSFDALRWHMHEMLFGYIEAAIAGFTLTAVPNWTGQRGYAGRGLAGLAALWITGRIFMLPLFSIPVAISASIDLVFVPAVLSCIIPSLIKAKNNHSYLIGGMLSLYWLANLLCWLETLGISGTWDRGVTLGFDVILMLIIAIGGRVIPSFTINYLRRQGQEPSIPLGTRIDRTALILISVLLVLHQAGNVPYLVATVSGVATIIHTIRLWRWRWYKTLQDPLVWILHASYLWVPIALGLHAAESLTTDIPSAAWRHALGVGAFSGMIIAIMSRAALGHTGRTLKAPRFMVAGYATLLLAAIIRVFIVPFIAPTFYSIALEISGTLWCLTFLIYVAVYTPILMAPRPDGRPG